MTAKAWGAQQRPVDEVFCQNEAVSLCMLVNRRAQTMRVIDFRAGPSPAKRNFVLSFAQREGVQKIYTVVERDEVMTWVKLGFLKEGSIPGFYKRSDAFLLGCSGGPVSSREGDDPPTHSETRLVAAKPLGATQLTAAQERMERTIAVAKKALKAAPEKIMPPAKLVVVDEAEARRAVAVALRAGRAMTAFEPFGRDVERRYLHVTVRGGFELHASIESQSCFGNAYLEILQGPRTDAEKIGTTCALAELCEALLRDDVVSCFALAPSDDTAMAAVYLRNGFRRTGLLSQHLVLGGERKDAILWSRKLATATDD